MDPGLENHLGPQQQFVQYMEAGQHYQDDADMPVQEEEESQHSYETDSGTDSDEDLHSGAEPYWRDVQAQTRRGCADECPAGIISEDFKVLTEAGHVDLTYGTNARVRIEEKYRRCVCERMVKGSMLKCENRLSAMAIRCRWKLCKKCRPD
jgi:hypothetical protein